MVKVLVVLIGAAGNHLCNFGLEFVHSAFKMIDERTTGVLLALKRRALVS